ncbi:MAG TPA: HEAT repeat domain-containing protein [Puia sp.]|nr:HEAT repeat domain-containing protein [Puia sp.]
MLNQSFCIGYYLLQSQEFPGKYIQPRYLLVAVEIITTCIFLVVGVIYSRLYFSKKTYLYKTGIRNDLEVWISDMIFNESEEAPAVPPKFRRIIKNRIGRQLVIDELVACKKNFIGITAKNIVALYEQLGLKKYSFKKLGSGEWHIKARGIQELYLMNQSDTLTRIYKNTNNRHELVRMEAQIGVLHITGFDGLRFLDVISYPLTEWQQIKLLEELKHSKMTERSGKAIPGWLQSANNTVVQFALKLADEYQQLELHDAIADCLRHPDEAVRSQAIKTLVRIANERTPSCLAAHFAGETFANKLILLDSLGKIAATDETSFLTGLLNEESNMIKLKAARALALSSGEGLAILARKSEEQPQAYQEIYLHVKAEMIL